VSLIEEVPGAGCGSRRRGRKNRTGRTVPGRAVVNNDGPSPEPMDGDRYPIRRARVEAPGRCRLRNSHSDIGHLCGSAQIVVRRHVVWDTGMKRHALGIEVCSQLLGAPNGLG